MPSLEEERKKYRSALDRGEPLEAIQIVEESDLPLEYLEEAFEAFIEKQGGGVIPAIAALETERLPEKFLGMAAKVVVEKVMAEGEYILAATTASRYRDYLPREVLKKASEKAEDHLEEEYSG